MSAGAAARKLEELLGTDMGLKWNRAIMVAETRTYRYRVDAADKIVWVDEWWLAFAQENGARQLGAESVIGRSLWNFVAGDETRKLYAEIHARVRKSGKPLVLPFRCDSPLVQRHMRLTITREDADELLYKSLLVRAEPQNRLGVLDLQRKRSQAFLTLCSCCKRALLEPVGWLEVEDVSVRLRLFEMERVPELHYTVCPECAHAMRDTPGNGNAA